MIRRWGVNNRGQLEAADDGEVVCFADHQQALSALEARIAELEKALQNLDDAVMREGIERTEDERDKRSGDKFIALMDALKHARTLSAKEPAPDPYTNTEGYIGPQ